MTIFVTGVAGFIGFHVAMQLLKRGDSVFGIDDLNEYYDVGLKLSRLKELAEFKNFTFQKINLTCGPELLAAFDHTQPKAVVHLAAQAGVRFSITNPQEYVDSNLIGFVNMLEACRASKPEHFIYASSSSVYGASTKQPYAETDYVDRPVSLYAATKKSNELLAYSYSHLYGIPMTGLRFFTVYGPWGRPDMAYYKFAEAIVTHKPIDIYNHGEMFRDFTYIDDVVDALIKLIALPPKKDDAIGVTIDPTVHAPARILNIGNHSPVKLLDMIEILEKALNRKALRNYLPMQPGDVVATYADVDALKRLTGFSPETSLEAGLSRFAAWFRAYHQYG